MQFCWINLTICFAMSWAIILTAKSEEIVEIACSRNLSVTFFSGLFCEKHYKNRHLLWIMDFLTSIAKSACDSEQYRKNAPFSPGLSDRIRVVTSHKCHIYSALFFLNHKWLIYFLLPAVFINVNRVEPVLKRLWIKKNVVYVIVLH